MKKHSYSVRLLPAALASAGLIVLVIFLALYSKPSEQSASQDGVLQAVTPAQITSTTIVSTHIANVTATSTMPPLPPRNATHAARDTRVAQRPIEWMTAIALISPTPLPTRGSPEPTPTFPLGMVNCASGDIREPLILGCWRGMVNGQIISVAGGRESSVYGDPSQGLILVFHGPLFDTSDPTTQIYRTPQRVGEVPLVAMNGMQAILTTTEHQPPVTFVFDISTRQWVPPGTPPPGPSPVPSLAPSPAP